MHLLLMTDRYLPEARSAAHLFADLAEGLARLGHHVQVLTKMPTGLLPQQSEGAPVPLRETISGVQVRRLAGICSSRAPVMLRAVDQLVLAAKFLWCGLRCSSLDAVVAYSPPLPLAIAAAIVGKLRRVPFVLNLHDIYPRTAVELGVLRNRFLIAIARLLERCAYRGATAFSVPAPGSRAYLLREQSIPAERVQLIFNWVDTDSIAPAPAASGFRDQHGLQGRFVISYAGVMGYAQDFSSIIQCAREMRSDSAVQFLLVGEGPLLARWKAESADLSNVRFLPSLEKGEYVQLLQASDLCLVPLSADLRSPAIPGKLQSIMAVGRPAVTIVPDESDAAWMVRESGCGVLVAPGDAQALYRAIIELRNDEGQRNRLGRQGRAYAEQNFRLDVAVKAFEGILRRVASA